MNEYPEMNSSDEALDLKKIEIGKLQNEEARLTEKIRVLQQNLIDLETKETSRLSSFRTIFSKEKEILTSELDALKKEKNLLEEKNTELNEKVATNEARLIELVAEQSNRSRILSSIEEYLPRLEEAVVTKESEFHRLLQEIELTEERLFHISNRFDIANRDLEIKKLQIDSYENSLFNAQHQVADLESRIKNYETLKNEIFSNIKNALIKENGLKEKIERLKKHLRSLEENRYEIESQAIKAEENFIAMANSQRVELNDLKIRLRDTSKKLIDKELTLFKKMEEISRKEKTIVNLELELRTLNYKLNIANEEILSLAARKTKLQNDISDLGAEKVKLENSHSRMLIELEKAGERSHETEESILKVIQNLKDEMESLKNARDEALNEYNSLEQRLALVKIESQRSERSISGFSQETEKLAAEKDMLAREISKLLEIRSKLESGPADALLEASAEITREVEPESPPSRASMEEEEDEHPVIPHYGYSGIDKELLGFLASELKDFESESINKELENLTASLLNEENTPAEPEIKIQPPADHEELRDLIKKINETPPESEEN